MEYKRLVKPFTIPCLRSRKELEKLAAKMQNIDSTGYSSAISGSSVTSTVQILSLNSDPVINDSRFHKQLCPKLDHAQNHTHSINPIPTALNPQPIHASNGMLPPLKIKRTVTNDGSYNYMVNDYNLPCSSLSCSVEGPSSNLSHPPSSVNISISSCSNKPSTVAGHTSSSTVSLEWLDEGEPHNHSNAAVTISFGDKGHITLERPLNRLRKRKRKKEWNERSDGHPLSNQAERTKENSDTLGNFNHKEANGSIDGVEDGSGISQSKISTNMSMMLTKEPSIHLKKNSVFRKKESAENIFRNFKSHTHICDDHTHSNGVYTHNVVDTSDHTVQPSDHTHNCLHNDNHAHDIVTAADQDIKDEDCDQNDFSISHIGSPDHITYNGSLYVVIDSSESASSPLTIDVDSPISVVDERTVSPSDDSIADLLAKKDLLEKKTKVFMNGINPNIVSPNSCTPIDCNSDQEMYKSMLLKWQERLNDSKRSTDALIMVENTVDLTPPPLNFNYISQNIYSSGVPRPDPMALYGCSCNSCNENSKCCPQMAGHRFPYYKNGKFRIGFKAPIFECNGTCSCDESCINRVVQKGSVYPLCIFRTHDGRGWGVKTCCRIEKSKFVTEYVGELITFEEAEKRGKQYDKEGATYLFDLDYNDSAEFTIDATLNGNVSHFLNHSCDPNLVVFSVWIDTLDLRLPRLALFARRDINIGEELTFDYQMNHNMMSVDPDKRTPCLCGTKKCRKYLF